MANEQLKQDESGSGRLKIWTNGSFTESAWRRLMERIPADEWELTTRGVDLESATIAFGQPEVEVVMRSPTLRWVQLDSAGYERYDRDDLRQHRRTSGVVITNSSTVYAQPCAEHTVAMMYGLARRLPGALAAQWNDHSWPMAELRAESRLLRRQRVVLLGYGAIGRTIVDLLAPLRMELTGYRRRPDGTETIPMVDETGLAAALGEADHVINILPASPATQGFCNADLLARIKPGAIFYNIGRGVTVDQEALRQALESGHLAAAWLDVTDPEPLPPDHPLWTTRNCLITPHTAGGHGLEKEVLVDHFLENLDRYRAGIPLADRILE